MTTSATQEDPKLAELDERARRAWAAYRENLVDLEGAAYDQAERAEWEHLQVDLREITAERTASRDAGEARDAVA